jgi:cysteine desulfuration protein SufE
MKLNEHLAEFADTEPDEALDLLMDFGGSLPPLSPDRAALGSPPSCRIQECQTSVYLWVDVRDGRVFLEAAVPEQSPTVRGFVALLVDGLAGASPADIERLPDDLLVPLGLQETLGMTRQRGFQGILARIKRDVRSAAKEFA